MWYVRRKNVREIIGFLISNKKCYISFSMKWTQTVNNLAYWIIKGEF